jgi:PAS domain S-box-containing protein
MKDQGNDKKMEKALLNLLEEQKTTIDKLKESQQYNRLLFEMSPIGMALCTLPGKHIDANTAYEKLVGRTHSEILNMSFQDFTPGEYLELCRQKQKELREKGSLEPYEREIIHKNGHRIIVKVSGVLFKTKDEDLVLVSVSDITKLKEDEKLLLEREGQFRSLYENTSIGFYRTTPEGKVLMANPTFVKMLGYKSFEAFAERNLERDTYEPTYNRDNFKRQIEKSGEIKGWEDKWLRRDGAELYVRESAHTVYDDKGNVLYYEGTVEDITESKEALRALHESEEIYRTVFATVNDSIFITDLDEGRILTCNDKLSGAKIEDIIGKTVAEINLWENLEEREKLVNLLKQKGSVYDYEANFKGINGQYSTGSISSNLIEIQNKKYMLSVVRDISERKRNEQIIIQSEEKFRTAFYTNPDAININRISDGLYISVNEGFTNLTGFTEEDVKDKTSYDINIWADPDSRLKLVAELKQHGKVINFEARFRMKNGSIRIGLMSGSVIKIKGVDHFLNITHDITERKEAEQQQWELKEELRTTLYSIGDAVISTDKEGIIKHMNPVAEQLTGWRLEEGCGKKLEQVFDIICEDTRGRVENPVARVLREGTIIGLANHTLLISKDGIEKPIADSGAPMRDKNGNITGVVLVFRDQTEERTAQDTLRRNEEKMRAIVEGTPDLFFYTQDADANTTYVSPTVEIITGYTPQQWIKAKDWFITDSECNMDAVKLTRDHLKGDFSLNTIQLEVRHADGSNIILEIFEYPVVQNGKLTGLQGVAHNITPRKKIENELQKTNETLTTIIHSSPLAIVSTDMEGIVTLWNPAAERIFGWKSDEIVGRPLPTIDQEKLAEYQELRERIKNNRIANYEIKRKRKDGSQIDVSVSSVLLHDQSGNATGILSLHADITSRKNYEKTLRKLYQATEQSPVSTIITDVNGIIEYVNPKLCSVSGYSFNEVIGKNPKIFKSGKMTSEQYKVMWDTLLSGKQWSGEFSNIKKNGSIYWESASISPIKNEEGAITHFIAVKEDITDRKKILEELILAKTKAEEANKTKDLFLANMSHELRTPLIGILGYSDLLAETLKEEESVEMAKGIKRSGKRLLNTLNMILNFTKIESEKYEINLSPVNIAEDIEMVYKMFYGAAIEKNLQYILNISDPDLVVNIDHSFLAVIIENLVNNALKFTEKGEIKIIAGKEKDDTVFIKVQDTGIGIEKVNYDAIFQEFRQISEGINREFQGTGLGLSIAKKYVEMMSGTIDVDSTFGKGSVFTVHFPLYKE